MHGPALSSQVLPPRLSRRRSVLGVRIGQFLGWQLIAALAIVALSRPGPSGWALSALAVVAACLTMVRWHHRWGYEWLFTAWAFGRARRQAAMITAERATWRGSAEDGRSGPPEPLLPVDVCPIRLRSGAEAGVAHDRTGFSLIVAVTPRSSAPQVVGLPVAALAGLLDPHDGMLSAVQLVLQAELGEDDRSILAGAYQNLGCRRVPRSQSAWLVLRHDPVLSRSAVGSAGSARDVRASLLRALAGRSGRALDLLASLSLKGQVLDAQAAEELLSGPLPGTGLAAEPADDAGLSVGDLPAPSWAGWNAAGVRHMTYWLRRWPADGLHSLQQELATIPARSVTTAVLVTAAPADRFGLTVTVRVTISQDSDQARVHGAVRAAAAACGARLTRLDGEHDLGLLATMPLGQAPASRWLSWRPGGTHSGDADTVLAITSGGVVIGPPAGGSRDGDLVALPSFAADGPSRTTVLADPLLHRLIGLRALASGARLKVVTAQPGPWLRLRNECGQPDRMAVVVQGSPPPADATRTDPWMVIDDTGSPPIVGGHPWVAVVTALGEADADNAVLPGQDTIVVQRPTSREAATIAATFGLPSDATHALMAIPDGLVAVVRPGTTQIARLVPDEAERSILTSSMLAA
jgi:type VII secretion protein EccE